MKYSYYPGCTLYAKAKGFDETTKACAKVLGIELVEVPDWTCCGSTYPLVTDNIMSLVAPVRNLAYSRKESENLITLCAFCYNVLKRTNFRIKKDLESQKKINGFLEEDIKSPYLGEVRVLHLLEILKDIDLGKHVQKKLEGLKVAPHYGCMLLQPAEEMEFDDPEEPEVLEKFLINLGAEAIDYPHQTECCGSYLTVSSEGAVAACSNRILDSAIKQGAEILITSCPLCHYNFDQRSKIPILYFTQLLAIALGMDGGICRFEDHRVDPRPKLSEKNLL